MKRARQLAALDCYPYIARVDVIDDEGYDGIFLRKSAEPTRVWETLIRSR